MRIVIATAQVPFVRGGAEILAEDLRDAIAARGHQVEIVALPWKWFPAESIPESILAFRLLDVSRCTREPIDRLIGLKFPAYLLPHPNKVLWITHQHRLAYELWDEIYGLSHDPRGAQARDVIMRADRSAFREARRIFTIAGNVSKRLECSLGIRSLPLYPPSRRAGSLYCAPAEDYLFFPSRITPLKRQDLALEALALTRYPVRIRFAGSGDPDAYAAQMKALAASLSLNDRVEWLGQVSREELVRHYAGALGVLFPPQDEDYGYVTVEGMLACKPVITCSDSGGPLEFVLHEETGLVADPEPALLAACFDRLWEDRDRARRWGENGRDRFTALDISWSRVVDALLQ